MILGYCFPSSDLPEEFVEGWTKAKEAFLENPIGGYFNDLYLSSRAIYISFGMSVVYSFVFIYLMGFFAETIAWVCIVLTQLAFIGAAVASFLWRKSLIARFDKNIATWTDEKAQNLIDNNASNRNYAMAGIIIFSIIAALFLLAICLGYKSLKLAIDVIDASADFLKSTKRIILVPVLYFFFSVIVFMVWIYAFLQVASMNKFVPDTKIIPQMKDLQWNDKNI
jgi:cytochrome c biogenesis factor